MGAVDIQTVVTAGLSSGSSLSEFVDDSTNLLNSQFVRNDAGVGIQDRAGAHRSHAFQHPPVNASMPQQRKSLTAALVDLFH